MLTNWNKLTKEEQERKKNLQVTLEEDMLLASEKKYWDVYDVHPDEGIPEQELLDRCIKYLEPAYQEWVDKISQSKRTPDWAYPLFAIGPKKMADITLRVIMIEWFGSNIWSRDLDIRDLPLPVAQHIALEISHMVIDILGYQKAKTEFKKDWFTQSQYLKSWTKKRCVAFAKKMNCLDRSKFTRKQKEDFGHHMLRIAEASGIIELKNIRTYGSQGWKEKVLVSFSESILKDLDSAHSDMITKAAMIYRPMICPPIPHSVDSSGGHLLSYVRKPVVQRFRDVFEDEEKAKKQIGSLPSQTVIDGLNALMHTEWSINTKVYEVMDQLFKNNTKDGNLPAYDFAAFDFGEKYPEDGTKEERVSWKARKEEAYALWYKEEHLRSRMLVRLKLAKDFITKHKFFYHVYTCDFRGRAYTACELLSPQSCDFDKALIMFATPIPQTKKGLYWLKVHIANLFDQDKITFDERIQWVDSNIKMLKQIHDNPYDTRSLWCSDKKKKNTTFQRLAAIFELFRTDGMTQLPIQMDGSCNGIQHWAAICKDTAIGKMVNLLDTGKPQDVYAFIADRCTNMMLEDKKINDWCNVFLDHWEGEIPRSVLKRAVMTDPYGVTFYGIRKYCRSDGHLDWVGKEKLSASVMELATYIDKALKGCLESANNGKKWLKDVADIASNLGKNLEWTTPCGFRVVHQYNEIRTRRSVAKLFNMKELHFGNADLTTIDAESVNNSISPNYIHSLDASHMWCVIAALLKQNINELSFVHDSYGTYAPYIEELRTITTLEFYEMYKHDQLQMLKESLEDLLRVTLPDVPAQGDLDIALVKQSPYFFQ